MGDCSSVYIWIVGAVNSIHGKTTLGFCLNKKGRRWLIMWISPEEQYPERVGVDCRDEFGVMRLSFLGGCDGRMGRSSFLGTWEDYFFDGWKSSSDIVGGSTSAFGDVTMVFGAVLVVVSADRRSKFARRHIRTIIAKDIIFNEKHLGVVIRIN
ncbi:hypothetical protein FQR65_LT11865 [Abscondita terminalis]|nr:hypothetical protein FQR65_LT11865 [Abscondita terminalis]